MCVVNLCVCVCVCVCVLGHDVIGLAEMCVCVVNLCVNVCVFQGMT